MYQFYMTYKQSIEEKYLVSLHGGEVQSPVKSPVGSSTVLSRIGLVSWKYPALWLTLTNPHPETILVCVSQLQACVMTSGGHQPRYGHVYII